MRIWRVMDDCIRTGVSSAEEKLPGRLGLRRRAPLLYRRLMRGYFPRHASLLRRCSFNLLYPCTVFTRVWPLLHFLPSMEGLLQRAISLLQKDTIWAQIPRTIGKGIAAHGKACSVLDAEYLPLVPRVSSAFWNIQSRLYLRSAWQCSHSSISPN